MLKKVSNTVRPLVLISASCVRPDSNRGRLALLLLGGYANTVGQLCDAGSGMVPQRLVHGIY